MMKKLLPVTLFICISLPGTVLAQQTKDNERAVSVILDGLHQAAASAEFDRYFGYYASEAIFLGTDATERWTLKEFQDYARPVFASGRGWTYEMTSRHIYISADKKTAWFDELLMNRTLGECRGSGVLVLQDGEWRISQYNLTIPIPNELAREVAGMIRELKK